MKRQAVTARLIGLLADGCWHAGPELARELGVTRARVSQQIRALRELGLEVCSVNGRGYRLREPLVLLDEAAIRRQLSADNAAVLDGLDVLGEVDSTNAWLMESETLGPRACFAEYQSAGRGRKQRPWASPFGANLYFSVACAITTPRAPLGALSLAVAVAQAECLQSLGAEGVGLKWPNDLMVDTAKLAGILTEHRGEASGRGRVVVGTGLNVSMQPGQAPHLEQPWARLTDCVSKLPERNVLAGRMLDAVLEALQVFQRSGFEPFQRRWQQLDVARDRAVTIDDGQQQRYGIARGIARDGALRIEFKDGVEPVYAGDVSLRIAP